MTADDTSNEIRLTRVYDAPVSAVWDAWTIPEAVARWWGPRGFSITTHSRELRPGGTWRYTMHGPDGVDYPNLTTYHVVERHERLVYDHGATDETPPLFRVTATFEPEPAGKTTLRLTFALGSPEAAAQIAARIKEAGGNATWDRLAEHLAEVLEQRQTFVIHRTFEAPIARLFELWARPAHLARWLPPAGSQLRFLRPDVGSDTGAGAELVAGQSTLFVITGAHGSMTVRAEYLEVERPRRVVYTQQFVDEHERPTAVPGTDAWPPTLLTTVVLAEEAPGRTRVTVTTEPHGATTKAELAAFVGERGGMTRGWTGSFDALEALLAR